MKAFISKLCILVLLVAGAAMLSSCGKSDASSGKTNGATTLQPVNVSIEELQLKDFTELVTATGTVKAEEDVMVPAEEGGRLVKWLVQKGAHVRAGQALVKLDDALLRAGFDAADAAYKIAQTNYEKQKRVYEEQALSELQLKTFEYQRDAAKAQMELAKARLDKMTIKSPINGVFDNKLVEAGEMVGPGVPVAHVVNLGTLKVEVGVPERYGSLVSSGDRVTLHLDAFPGQTFTGTVRFVGAAVNRDSRSITVDVSIANVGGKLKPDMIATAEITLGVRKGCIVIQQDFIQQADKGRLVVYVSNNGTAEERAITIGGTNGNLALVTSGLNAGDKLITLGFQNVANGQPLVIGK
jgi:RND family efflux transporter MFP subunit